MEKIDYDVLHAGGSVMATKDIKPRNQIESLEKEIAELKEIIHRRDTELLKLYRQIHATDRAEQF